MEGQAQLYRKKAKMFLAWQNINRMRAKNFIYPEAFSFPIDCPTNYHLSIEAIGQERDGARPIMRFKTKAVLIGDQ